MGAFVGGLYAREGDIISSSGRTKQFSGRMGNFWRMLSDVTYPIVAYTTVRTKTSSVLHDTQTLTCRAMSSIGQYTRYEAFFRWPESSLNVAFRRSMICTLRTCGCHTSATRPISTPPGWRSMRPALRGDSSVGFVATVVGGALTPYYDRCFDDARWLVAPTVR